MICLPCVPSLAALKRKVNYNEDPEIILVYVDYMEYGRTHRHSLRRARLTHQRIRDGRAMPAYPKKPNRSINVWVDQAVRRLINPDIEQPFIKTGPNMSETGVSITSR